MDDSDAAATVADKAFAVAVPAAAVLCFLNTGFSLFLRWVALEMSDRDADLRQREVWDKEASREELSMSASCGGYCCCQGWPR